MVSLTKARNRLAAEQRDLNVLYDSRTRLNLQIASVESAVAQWQDAILLMEKLVEEVKEDINDHGP